jgi:hypothetical protein
MAVYKTRWFDRWAHKQGLDNLTLCIAVSEIVVGLYDADLGGGLVKKRVSRSGGGSGVAFVP